MELFTDKAAIIADYMELFDNNLSVMMVGYHNFHHIEPMRIKRWQKFYTVHFVLAGQGLLEIYGKKHKVKAHQMFLISPDENMRYFPDSKDPWSYVWIDFVGDIAHVFAERMGFSKENPCIDCSSIFAVQSLAKNFFDDYESGEGAGYFAALALFYSVIEAVSIKSEKPRAQTLRDQVLFYIDMHFHEETLKVRNICTFFNISHSYLCSLFKEGITVKDLITTKRLEEAKRLLSESDLFVGEVGRSVGFANIDHFMKAFKKHTGMTAKEYRRFSRSQKQEEKQ